MNLEKTKYRIRCEMGGCRNLADSSVRFSRMGIRSSLHACKDCLGQLYQLIGDSLVDAQPVEDQPLTNRKQRPKKPKPTQTPAPQGGQSPDEPS